MKAAPVMRALGRRSGIAQSLVHTGQHYDVGMSGVFFEQLGLPAPDVNLEVGSGTHARQTAEVMTRLEPELLARKPDLVMVYGDVNSTAAAALTCAKLQIAVAHVEAGLRAFDRSMPEEINRVVTDQLSAYLFTPSADADVNLGREGIGEDKIHLVGNVMIDSLVQLLPTANRCPLPEFAQGKFALLTLHRPSNVDDPLSLAVILDSIAAASQDLTVIFPVHPRTRQKIAELGWANERYRLVAPTPYVEFIALQKSALFVMTDSGGIQEETTYLGVPCFTLRENTERPVTITHGTNTLVGQDAAKLKAGIEALLNGHRKPGLVPELWDGHAAERIADVLLR